MATIYKNPSLAGPDGVPQTGGESYSTYQEPDTRVPPKAGPVIPRISVNGTPVAERDILAEAQNHPAKNPGAALRAAAEALVIQELLWQEASRLGIAGKPRAEQMERSKRSVMPPSGRLSRTRSQRHLPARKKADATMTVIPTSSAASLSSRRATF